MRAPRPRLVLSECMADVACRYDGATVRDDFVGRLGAFVDWVRVCPEVRIGLGVPRDPIRVVEGAGGERLLQPATGRDLTREMRAFAEEFLDATGEVDGFLLKARSPSCGPTTVKVLSPGGRVRRRGAGFFARAVLSRSPDRPVEDEERLGDPAVRHRFLVRAFASARFRGVAAAEDLARFHAGHEALLLAHDPRTAPLLRRLCAEAAATGSGDARAAYGHALRRALARAPSRDSVGRALEHLSVLVPRGTPARDAMREALALHAEGRLPPHRVASALRNAARAAGGGALATQALAEPYPAALDPADPSARPVAESPVGSANRQRPPIGPTERGSGR